MPICEKCGAEYKYCHKCEYICKCGRKFTNVQSYVAHCGHCKDNLGKSPEDRFGESRSWNKGLSKDTDDRVRIIAEKVKSDHLEHPEKYIGHLHTEESKRKLSETMKARYASGELTPAPGVGRGKYSYLLYGDKRILLRSTYEFIYALYLLYQGIDFEYETVRVTYLGHTYISDSW